MKVKVKEIKRQVSLLTDPQPTFMSLVNNGANQTPFVALKSDNPNPPSRAVTPNNSEEDTTMSKAGKGATRKHVVTRLNFSKDVYKTVEDVQAYIDEKGIGNVEIIDDKDVFAAKTTEDLTAFKLDKARSTATKDGGVTAFVAEILGPADAANNTENKVAAASKVTAVNGNKVQTKKGGTPATDTVLRFPEAAKKFDMWSSYMSNEGSLLGVLEDGIEYDGVPPGVDTVMAAAYYTIGNILGDPAVADKAVALKQLGDDISTLCLGLYELFVAAGAVDDNESAEKKAKKAKIVTAFKTSTDAAKWDGVAKLAFVPKLADNVIDPPVVEKAAVVEKTAVTPPVVPGVDLSPVMDAIKALGTDVAAKFAGVDQRLTNVETSYKSVNDTLSRSTTRKSMSEAFDDVVVVDPDAANKDVRKKELRGILGVIPSRH